MRISVWMLEASSEYYLGALVRCFRAGFTEAPSEYRDLASKDIFKSMRRS